MKKTIKSYLSQLKFDSSLTKMSIAKYLTNVRLVGLFLIGIIIFGIFSFSSLQRRLNPEISIPIVSVITAFPGAGPAEVEELVTIPLENKLTNAKNLQTLSSNSTDNVSIITAEFSSSVAVDDARQEIQKLVAQVNNLPADSLEPSIRELDFENVPVWEFILTTDGSRATLEKAANVLKDELETNNKIDRLIISGIEEKEIQIILDPQKVKDYGITPIGLSGIISSSTKSLPAGKVKTDSNAYTISLGSSINSIDEIRNIPLKIKGAQVLLGDLAEVRYKSGTEQKRSYVSNNGVINQSAVTISVYKTSSADITDAQQVAAVIVDEVVARFDNKVEIIDLENVANDISEQFSELYSNFSSTIFLVFATLFVFLGLKQALIASLSIPLTFFISFITMGVTGQSLNFLTLFALLIGLGLLVDDAIVIISAMTTYYKTKKFTPTQTGLLVWRDFLVPIWTTTITTVWAFVPLLLSSGIIGEFIKPIPIVVSSTLLASTTVAVLITLPMMMILLKFSVPKRVVVFMKVLTGLIGLFVLNKLTAGQPLGLLIFVLLLLALFLILRWKKQFTKTLLPANRTKKITKFAGGGFISMEKISERYKKFINKILKSASSKKKIVAAVIIISLFSYALVPLGLVVNEFFPKTDSELIFVTLELPTGSTLNKTESMALNVSEALLEIEEAEMINTEVGKANRSSSQNSSAADNLAAISLRLKPTQDRKRSSDDISKQAKEIINRYGIDSRVYAESGGPPAGSDVTVKVIGKDLSQLQSIGDEIENKLGEIEGTKNVDRSIKQGNSKIVFKPNTIKLNEHGFTLQDVSLWLRTAVSGFELSEVDFDLSEEETKVVFYLSDSLLSPEEISEISIIGQKGSVPLLELGELVLEPTPSVITRENGNRTLTITSDITTGFNAGMINEEILEYSDNLDIPRGYSFATGGANEENQKSVQSIMQAMVLSLLLIVATMVIQLGSFRQSLIVILVIPLAISGVFIMFALTGTPLSFPALIGVLALFGIVVNNSIMVVDKINQNIRIGMKQIDAITDAAASRLEPIFFSSLTTIIGLVPITLSDPLWQGLGGAIISGLMFSGVVMLLIIPVSYTYFFPEN
jgi:multidrug efflux pump subunit AcrB